MRKGEELKAPRYASAAATRDYITIRDIIPNSNFFKEILLVFSIVLGEGSGIFLEFNIEFVK